MSQASLKNSQTSSSSQSRQIMAKRENQRPRFQFSRQLGPPLSTLTCLTIQQLDQSQCFVVLNGWLVGWIQFSMPASRSLHIRNSNESKFAQTKSQRVYLKLKHNKLYTVSQSTKLDLPYIIIYWWDQLYAKCQRFFRESSERRFVLELNTVCTL